MSHSNRLCAISVNRPCLENFVSNRTRRKFKAKLVYDKKEGKVVFEFEPRPERKAPAKKAPAKKAAKA